MKITALVLAVMLMFVGGDTTLANTLWYNGDADGVDGWTNGTYIDGPQLFMARVYDDFVVDGSGWRVNAVLSNNYLGGTFPQADWSIRSGVSAGNGGTLVASGVGDMVPVPTGRALFGYNEYTVKVTGLDIFLAPGRYWLNVAAVGTAPGSNGWIVTFNSTTSGLNAIGDPLGNNQNSFWDDPNAGANFTPFTSIDSGYNYDFSMGIDGQTTPIPGSLVLLGSGLVALFPYRRFLKP